MKRMIGIAILALLAAACSPHQDASAKRELTERERDSVMSKSDLPGAGVVGRAMSTSDAEARHSSSMNAAVDSLPH